MTLNKQKTATLPQEFVDWIVGYNAGDLYGTNEDNSTFQFTNIKDFPILPER